MAVNPTGKDLKRFLLADPDAPVVMLNLLRFRPGGRAVYEGYVTVFRATIAARFGAVVHYVGDGCATLVGESGQDWDAVLLVGYPSRRAFCAMVADPEYQEITRARTAALAEAVLQAYQAWPGLGLPDQTRPRPA